MAYKILMDTEGVEKFRQQVSNICQTINGITGDLNYLLNNFNQVSFSMNILKQHMCQAISEGKKVTEYLNRMASDVEKARQAFIAADSNTSGIESAVFSPFVAGVVGSADKVISVASKKGHLGKRTDTIETGINRVTRRAFDIPKTIEEVKPFVKLREGFGVCGTVLAAGTAVEDWKNNSSIGTKAASIAIDGGATVGEVVTTADAIADFGATAAVGLVEVGAAAIGLAAAPEIAIGATAVVGGAVAVGFADGIVSWGVSKLKDSHGLK